MAHRVTAALATLDIQIVRLEKKRKENDIRKRIVEIEVSFVGLETLRNYSEELRTIDGYSISITELRDREIIQD